MRTSDRYTSIEGLNHYILITCKLLSVAEFKPELYRLSLFPNLERGVDVRRQATPASVLNSETAPGGGNGWCHDNGGDVLHIC